MRKHNFAKRYAAYAKAMVSQYNLAVVYISNGNPKKVSQLIDSKRMQPVKMTKNIVQMIARGRFKWSMYIAAFCQDQNGQKYIAARSVHFDNEYSQGELVDLLNEEHQELIDAQNPLHYKAAGWIASPSGVDFSEDKAAEIFDMFNCWPSEDV